MASEKSLVVKQASLAGMASTIESTHEEIRRQVEVLISGVNDRTSAWSESTISRAAEMDYQRRLKSGIEQLTENVLKIRSCLDQIASDAHECEVENVALVD